MTSERKRNRDIRGNQDALDSSDASMDREQEEDEGEGEGEEEEFDDVFEDLSDEDIIMDPSMIEGVPEDDEEEICFDDVKTNLGSLPIKDKYEEAEEKYKKLPKKVYLPTVPLEEGHELVHDPSAYNMFHEFHTEWPCLSFDILQDTLGKNRIHYPHTMTLFAGSQADVAKKNKIFILKCVGLDRTHRSTKKRAEHESDSDSDDSDSEEESELNGKTRSDPILVTRSIPHMGAINRIRIDKASAPTQTIVATWSELGSVHIWDASTQVSSLATSDSHSDRNLSQKKKGKTAIASGKPNAHELPIYTVKDHKDEGYAMDWSTLSPGRLLSGDRKGCILLTERSESGYVTQPKGFLGHTASVEDLAWSPIERQVFASASMDQTLAIWDTRAASSVISNKVATSDVNVISWNPSVHYLMASGSDDGSFCTWDLRYFKTASPMPLVSFSWHRGPVTSIEWHPHDASVLAVSGSDDQLTIWDFSLEADAEAGASLTAAEEASLSVPPQLLFIHQGQKDMKEAHWHSQIPGALVSTAASGFNIFKTINI